MSKYFNVLIKSLFEPFPIQPHSQIGRHLKVTLAYRGFNCSWSDKIIL